MTNYWNRNYYSQPDAELLKQKAEKSKSKAQKKGIVYEPIIIKGRNICNSWWGKAWCENLERYADYASRIDRGKRYVRNGSVIDLKIQKGKVTARVQGTRATPYKVEIKISYLSEDKCQAIMDKCGQKIENIEQLVNGEFPTEMKTIFLDKDGLFPSPSEISFNCSCPDWAIMCKHVAAVLYGIGAKFDQDPLLFFELRGIDINRFIDVALQNKVENMLNNAYNHTSRMMDDEDDLASIFELI